MNEPTATSTPEAVSGARLSKSEYEERYPAVGELNAERVRDLQQALESAFQQDADGIARVLDEFAQVTRSEAEQLGALRPPSDIAGEHEGYVDLLRETASAHEQVAQAAADASTPEAAVVELGRLQQLFGSNENQQRARAFARAVQQGGYDLGLGPGDSTLPGQSRLP